MKEYPMDFFNDTDFDCSSDMLDDFCLDFSSDIPVTTGSIQDFIVNGESVIHNYIGILNLKSINNEPIIGIGNIILPSIEDLNNKIDKDQVASDSLLGLVKSSSGLNHIIVNNDGSMNIDSLGVDKLRNVDENELVINSNY